MYWGTAILVGATAIICPDLYAYFFSILGVTWTQQMLYNTPEPTIPLAVKVEALFVCHQCVDCMFFCSEVYFLFNLNKMFHL